MSIKRFLLVPAGRIHYPNSTAALSILVLYTGGTCLSAWTLGKIDLEPRGLITAAVMAVLSAMMLYDIMRDCRPAFRKASEGDSPGTDLNADSNPDSKTTAARWRRLVRNIIFGLGLAAAISLAIKVGLHFVMPSSEAFATMPLLFAIALVDVFICIGAFYVVRAILRAGSDYGRLFLSAMPGWVQRWVSGDQASS